MDKKIYIGADYRGFEAKNELVKVLAEIGYEVMDVGAYKYEEGDDFNDPAIAVAKAVRKPANLVGILICDSAHGVTIQANRFKGIRAANCDNIESAKLAREHDNANILCMSAHFIGKDKMKEIAKAFLETEFEFLPRRQRRIKRLDEGEGV